MTIILGIDPGLQRTGWGIIRSDSNVLSFVAAGVIKTITADTLPARLAVQHAELSRLIALHAPHQAAIEQTFVNVNGASTLKLGQARGAILLTLSLAGLPVAEYAPNAVKKSLCGSGHGAKSQIAAMVKVLLPKCNATAADATDALAIAICHAHHQRP